MKPNCPDCANHICILLGRCEREAALTREKSEMSALNPGKFQMPTHRCKLCSALWREHDGGDWSLCSPSCGQCCDNAPMGEQIESLYAVATCEVDRLSRELDITNADAIGLWLETNIKSAPMGWLACRVVEAHEAAIAAVTGTPTPEGELIECHRCCGNGQTFGPNSGEDIICPDCEGTGRALRCKLSGAQGMAARSGETERLDPKGNSPVGETDAPKAQADAPNQEPQP